MKRNEHSMWRMVSRRALALPACAIALATLGYGIVGAQLVGNGGARTVSGRIEDFTTAPRGEVDGATLDDGTVLHWPPHVGERMANMLKRGDRVEAAGQTETGPAGDTHFEVTALTNRRTDQVLNVAGIAPPERGRRGGLPPRPVRDVDESRTLRGAIERFTTAPRGEVDGAVLSDGSIIHWPPHLEERFKGALAVGDQVKVMGWMETTPRGDTHLEVANVTDLRTGASIDNDDARVAGVRRFSTDRRTDRDERFNELQAQLDRIQRELDMLRRER